jgi:ATP-binding cassette subfamily B protein
MNESAVLSSHTTPTQSVGQVGVYAGAGAFIWEHIKRLRWNFGALATTVIAAAACGLLVQYQLKFLVDAITGGVRGSGEAWSAVKTFIVLVAVESLLWRTSGWLTCRTTIAAGVQMKLDLFAHLSGQSMRYFAENLAGSLGQRLTGTAGAFGALTNIAVWRIAPPCVDFSGGLAVLVSIHWPMALAMGAYVAVISGGLLLIAHFGRRRHSAYHAKASEVAGDLVDVISNMWLVKAFTAHQREWIRLRDRFEKEASLQRGSWMYTERTRLLYDVVMWVMAATMLLWAVGSWAHARITAGDVVVITTLTFRILHGSRDVVLAFVESLQQFSFIEETLRVVGRIHGVCDAPGARRMRRGPGAVEFRNVSFGYDPGRPVLRNVSFCVSPGEKVGIVGLSGAGKTTIAQLLQRLYDVGSGQILIDGEPIANVTQESLSASLAVVPQDITLLHRSVMDNIRFGRPEASDQEVVEAAIAASCDGFVSRLSAGYDTIVGERGVKLSGGQRQRVGIARALLKDAPILILDEATSALDTESELRVQANIVRMFPDRTVLAIAHRLSTLTSFDRILVVNEGHIVEEGGFQELRNHGRLFRHLWRMQAEGIAASAPSVMSKVKSVAQDR